MQEKTLLLNIIRHAVCGEELILPSELSDQQLASLYDLSKIHDLSHIVGLVLKEEDFGTESIDLYKKFQQSVSVATYRYMTISLELEQIYATLEKSQIPYMPLKGAIIRSYYPSPEMRTSSDIDILVHEEDLSRAVDLLCNELSYKAEERGLHDISLFSPGGVHLELHFTLNDSAKVILPDVWMNAYLDTGSEFRYIMNNDVFVVYHISHMADHFTYGGCGIRFLLDLWIAKNRMGYDSDKVYEGLESCGLLKFGNFAMRLSEIWFSDGEHTKETREMESYILGSGIYGTMENQIAISQSHKKGKIGYLFGRIFLSYDKMRALYPLLSSYPILLPYYHVKRWFLFLLRKDKSRTFDELYYNQMISEQKKKKLSALCQSLDL